MGILILATYAYAKDFHAHQYMGNILSGSY